VDTAETKLTNRPILGFIDAHACWADMSEQGLDVRSQYFAHAFAASAWF
jgi:hypothetical protein